VHELFVGRAAELAELGRQFDRASAGHGRVVLLAGPAGIGKTAIIRRCLSAWAGRARPALASGDAEEAALPGGLLAQLAHSHTPAAAHLAAVSATGPADPLTAGSALLAFLREEACAATLVVVIDDAQWGDELSLKAIAFALRRLHSDPVLCLIATRPEDLYRLPHGVTRLADDHGLRLDLAGLATTEVAALAELTGAGELPYRAAQRLRDHTAGVPLHLRELLHDLPAETLRTPGTTLPAPRSLETLVLSRLAACALDTERLVVAAAVLGTDCSLSDAAALAGLADPLPALQEAIAQRLLQDHETAGRRRCVFSHSLIRTAIYRDIGVSQRAALHRAAAGLTAGGVALSHRTAGCCGTDPQLAADLAAQAAVECSDGQLSEAAEHLLMAAQTIARGPDRDRWLLTAVGLLIDLGDAARARAYADEVAALAPSAQRSLLLGRLAMLSGDYPGAGRQIAAAWAAGSEPPSAPGQGVPGAGQAASELALMLVGQHRLDDAAAWAERASGIAGSGLVHASCCAVRAGSLAAGGHCGPARALLEAELGRCGDAGGRTLLRAALGAVLLFADDLRGAARHLDAAIAASGPQRLAMPHLLEARLHRVLAGYRGGDWDEAAADGQRLVTLIEDLGQSWLLARALLAAVYVAAGRGHWPAATGYVEAAARQPAARSGYGVVALADARAAIAVARDEPEGVVVAAADAAGDVDLLSHVEPGRLFFWPACAQALARTGRQGEAEIMLRRYEELSLGHGRRSAMAEASRARGVLEAMRERPDEALTAFHASLRYLDGLGMPLAEAMTRLEYGRLLRRLGQARLAARELGAARTLFVALGAQPFVVRCDDELPPGSRPASGAVSPPLTARQLSVARAAAAGKSNRQIAAEMYISVKTVEFHLGQILARLSVDSRTQIADALAAGAQGRGPARIPD
jgi:DNA-binding CsgD family transcriptional regulator